MSNCKDSMYKMAEQHKIPDWLINLRHEAAHGNSVPALYMLRQASDIILQWLQVNLDFQTTMDTFPLPSILSINEM